eukprot:m.207502 g.207502  ORF g.207502 m.207502 type:complete len:405 (+) comp15445_c0_seq2:337-1551(+)
MKFESELLILTMILWTTAPHRPCRTYDTACAAADLFQTKYRRNWTAATEYFVARSKEWGFNSAGYEFITAPGISWPYFPDLFVTNASHIFARSAFGSASFPDVFAGDFVAVTDRRVAEWCARDQHIDAARVPRNVVGSYFEDQPIWDVSSARMLSLALDPNTGNVSGPTDWEDAMRTLPESAPGKHAYVAWLKQRYGGDLSTVRPIYSLPSSVKTWVEVEMWDFHTVNGLQSTVVADDNEFIGVVADQLFGVAAGAVRRHDPRALVLGQRFISHDAPTSVLQAAGRHFDVISVQPSIFSPESPDQALVNISKTSERPVMVADQSSHYVEPGPPGTLQPSGCTPLQSESTQCARYGTAAGALYAAFLSGLRSRSEIVGVSYDAQSCALMIMKNLWKRLASTSISN